MLGDLCKRLFAFGQRIQKLEESNTSLREEVKVLTERLERLYAGSAQLAFEIERDRLVSERDREILRLQLENALLRLKRELPPGTSEQ